MKAALNSCLLLMFITLSTDAKGGGAEGGVPVAFTRVEIVAGQSGYRLSFEMNENGDLLGLSTSWKGVSHVVKAEGLGVSGRVYIRGVRIVAPTEYSMGEQPTIIVVLPYNVQRATGKYDVVRIYLTDGKLSGWETAVANKENPLKWDFKIRLANGEVKDGGSAEGQRNPYGLFEINDASP